MRLALNDNLKGDKEVKRTVLARSTESAWLMEGDSIDLKARERWNVPGYNGPYVLGVALEGKLPSAFAAAQSAPARRGPRRRRPTIERARARREDGARAGVRLGLLHARRVPARRRSRGQTLHAAARSRFALNAIDWLAQDSDLIEIRAKNIEDPMLEVPQNVREAEATIKRRSRSRTRPRPRRRSTSARTR